jgi:hypothetical protein
MNNPIFSNVCQWDEFGRGEVDIMLMMGWWVACDVCLSNTDIDELFLSVQVRW